MNLIPTNIVTNNYFSLLIPPLANRFGPSKIYQDNFSSNSMDVFASAPMNDSTFVF